MAASVTDKQRNDFRQQTLENPYWFSAKAIDHTDLKNKQCVVGLFKAGAYRITDLYLDFQTALAGVASLDVTVCEIAAASVTNGVVADGATMVNETTLKLANSASGFATLAAAVGMNTIANGNYVALIVKELTASPNTITAGKVKAHFFMTKVPV